MLTRLPRTALLLLIIPALQLLIPVESPAQSESAPPSLGIYMDHESVSIPTADQLSRLQALGVTHLEISPPLEHASLQSALESGFYLMVQQPRRFVTTLELQKSDSLYLSRDLDLIRQIPTELATSSGVAFSPFVWPYDHTVQARDQLKAYADRLRRELSDPDIEIYYSSLQGATHDEGGWDANVATVTAGSSSPGPASPIVRILPHKSDSTTLHALYRYLDTGPDESPSLVLISWSWLDRMLDQHPWLNDLLVIRQEDGVLVKPYPKETQSRMVVNQELGWILMMAMIYLLLFRYSSFIRESGWRYFTSHTYYKEQILPYRLRSATPGLLLQAQLLLMWMLLWSLLYQSLPIQGQLLLEDWVFQVQTEGGGFWVPLQWVFLLASLHLLFLTWVWMFNSRYGFKEILALFGWPLQLLVLPTLLLVLLFWNGVDPRWIGAGSAIWILLWTAINYVTALDILRSLEERRVLYGIALTLHLSLTLLLFLSFIFYPTLQEPLHTLWILL